MFNWDCILNKIYIIQVWSWGSAVVAVQCCVGVRPLLYLRYYLLAAWISWFAGHCDTRELALIGFVGIANEFIPRSLFLSHCGMVNGLGLSGAPSSMYIICLIISSN